MNVADRERASHVEYVAKERLACRVRPYGRHVDASHYGYVLDISEPVIGQDSVRCTDFAQWKVDGKTADLARLFISRGEEPQETDWSHHTSGSRRLG